MADNQQPKSTLDKYKSLLRKSDQSAAVFTGLGALANIKAIEDTRNAPLAEPMIAPKIPYSHMMNPSPMILNQQYNNSVIRSANTSRRQALEMGMPENIAPINQTTDDAFYKAAITNLGSEFETMNKNVSEKAKVDAMNAEMGMNVDSFNRQVQMKTNEMDSKIIMDALNNLHKMGVNLFTDYLPKSRLQALLAEKGYAEGIGGISAGMVNLND